MNNFIKAAIGAGAAAAATGAAIGISKLKKNNFCPKCYIKKLQAAKNYNLPDSALYNNSAALTPPMGWSSWNAFRQNIDENLIYDMALVMKESGLLDAGYKYVNLDDCWHSSMRDENGKLQGDLAKFPSGIKALCEKVNSLGLKLGIYTSNGTLTCEDLPASLGKEAIDADTFAQWGIEFFKYDFCHNVPISGEGPDLDRIYIALAGSSDEQIIEAETGRLTGTARIMNSSRLESGKYVTGLGYANGAVEFDNIEVQEDGEYTLTLGTRKNGEYEKFAQIVINSTDKYDITIPPTKTWTPVGRDQIRVKLKKGKNTIKIHNPIGSKLDSAAYQYMNMGKELKRATKEYAEKNGTEEKPIVYSICEWGKNKPWKWGRQAGNLWRTTPDIMANWPSIVGIYEFNVRLAEYAGRGGWNDPDMLEVGNGKLTYEENKTHFTLWCMMAAPLILGNDLRKFRNPDGTVDKDNKVLKILTNRELIAIDQDELGVQCRRYKMGVVDILVKPLADKSFALCFFNKGVTPANAKADLSDICNQSYIQTEKANSYTAKELWSGEELTIGNTISAQLPPRGVKVYRVYPSNK